MNFDLIKIASCVVPSPNDGGAGGGGGGHPLDQRCLDATFAAANPSICSSAPYLIIKPSYALVCRLGSIQFEVYTYQNGVETLVTDGLTFTSSDNDILAIGVHTGAATGLADGEVNVSVSRNGITAKAGITVLVGDCSGPNRGCDQIKVLTSILLDCSKSTSLSFGGGYQSRLDFAKSAALQYADKILNLGAECVNLIPASTPYSEGEYVLTGLVVGKTYRATAGSHESTINYSGDNVDFLPGEIVIFTATQTSVGFDTTPDDFSVTAIICEVTAFDGQPKDAIKIWSFDDTPTQVSTGFINDVSILTSQINGIVQTQTKTDLAAIMTTAINDLMAAESDEAVLVLISDGEQTLTTDIQPILDIANTFKQVNGIIICIGLRASGAGYDLLSRVATGGFFLNATSTNADDILKALSYLKSQLCAGECITESGTVNTPVLDYSSFLNWEVIAGQVNLIGLGLLDLQPGNGLYVDLNGGTAGTIRTIDSFSLIAGRDYRISFKAAGNNRMNTPAANQSLLVTVKNANAIAPTNQQIIFQHALVPAWDDPFTAYAFTFTPQFDVDVKILFQQLHDSAFTGEWHGDLIDAVVFEDTTTLTTLFSDNFDAENPVSVSARPYGDDCSSIAAGTQAQDPNPLPDVENGLPVTTTYTSTKQACASCHSGQINSGTNMVPIMTSNTEPVGEAFSPFDVDVIGDTVFNQLAFKAFNGVADGSPHNAWAVEFTAAGDGGYPAIPLTVQYKFNTPQTIASYSIVGMAPGTNPSNFTLDGSNDGSSWTTLDTESGLFWYAGEEKNLQIGSPTSYLYYRLSVTKIDSNVPVGTQNCQLYVQELKLYSAPVSQVCRTATATSFVSQADADAKATAAALAQAQAALNCLTQYTSTQQYTAQCPAGSFGSSVTKSATATSLISQQDADNRALTSAQSAANAELVCNGSNNTQKITINDATGVGQPSPATPYPSVKFVSGLVGNVTKVTVAINGLTHASPEDIHLVLMAPNGATVSLMRHCGQQNAVSNINLVFDDAGATNLPDGALITAGTYKPTQLHGASPLPLPGPQPAYGTTLASLIGIDPNGSWSIWCIDDAPIDLGQIANGWNITITSI